MIFHGTDARLQENDFRIFKAGWNSKRDERNFFVNSSKTFLNPNKITERIRKIVDCENNVVGLCIMQWHLK